MTPLQKNPSFVMPDGVFVNIGCGESRIEGFFNVDCVETEVVKPDIICDIRKEKLPFKDGEVDQVWMIHSLEHIEMFHWKNIFDEFLRVLKDNGTLLLAYPEFKVCAHNFIHNVGNQKAFWRNTLYGRQLYSSDYHYVPMDSLELKDILEVQGFYRVAFQSESEAAPYNSNLIAIKDPDPIKREEILVKELHL